MIVRDVELWYCKLNPAKPNAKYDSENPRWELQIRTTDIEVKKDWVAKGFNVKPVVPEDGSPVYYRVNFMKRSKDTKTGKAKDPVAVVDAKNRPVDPTTIGNGSIGHINLYEYAYVKDGKAKQGFTLMAIQLKRHKVYKSTGGTGFDDLGEDTEVLDPDGLLDEDEEESLTTTAKADDDDGIVY